MLVNLKEILAIAGYIAEDATVESADDLDRVIRESLRDDLMTNKVIEYLYERCEVKEPSAGDAEEAEEGATEEAAAAASTSESPLLQALTGSWSFSVSPFRTGGNYAAGKNHHPGFRRAVQAADRAPRQGMQCVL